MNTLIIAEIRAVLPCWYVTHNKPVKCVPGDSCRNCQLMMDLRGMITSVQENAFKALEARVIGAGNSLPGVNSVDEVLNKVDEIPVSSRLIRSLLHAGGLL